jgi:EAL domain-containing protein (putative c-di-GMP-specific phosphodiesterase class I)
MHMAIGTDSGHGARGRPRGRPFNWPKRIAEALDRDRFVLHAQRIVDVRTGEAVRHELFLRMVYRQRLIPAGDFVLEAEKLGSIREIDRWVVGKAIELAATGRPVDLNLSVRSTDDAMLELIERRLDESGANPDDVVLELSEAQLSGGLIRGSAFVEGVTDLGCRVALDGFIEGGRDTYLLRKLPISFIKLGPHFIGELGSDRALRREVSGAVLTAHRCGQRVIAQGVESLATLQLLEGLGIDEAQGHALGPPESLEVLLEPA